MLEKIVAIGTMGAGFYEGFTGDKLNPHERDLNNPNGHDSSYTPAICMALALGWQLGITGIREIGGEQRSSVNICIDTVLSLTSYFIGYGLGKAGQ